MRVQVNDKWVTVPSSLNEITLKQRIDFQNEHGNLLLEMEKSILEMSDDFEKEMALTELQLEKMFRTVAFFLGTTVDAVKESEFLDQIVSIYMNSFAIVFQEEMQEEVNLKTSFIWKGDEWVLHVPELKHGSKMTFGEFIDSKQMIQDMISLGKNKWECMLPLCAIFLRKKGEAYQESFLYEGSDRLRLMESLPMDIALQVGFFLSSSLDLYMKVSRSLKSPEPKKPENLLKNTSSALVG